MLERLPKPRHTFASLLPFFLLLFFLFIPAFSYGAQVALAWDSVDPTPEGYRLYQRLQGEEYDYDNPIYNGLDTTATIDNLEDGTTHFFVVRAYVGALESADSNEVSYTVDPIDSANVPMEFGDVSINQNWTRVTFEEQFSDPVVVVGPLSTNDDSPAVIRIRNVDETGFQIRVQEWDYLDGEHSMETISYLVMEQGTYTLENGIQIEADTVEISAMASFEDISFLRQFDTSPILMTAITSYNGGDTVTERIKNVTIDGFQGGMEEQEDNAQKHNPEMLSYIAWEPSSGFLGGTAYLVAKTSQIVNHNYYNIVFKSPIAASPSFLADMQTCKGNNTANIRYTNKDDDAVDVRISEEQSLNDEINHVAEVVGYMMFSN